jgi:hypothetical protein
MSKILTGLAMTLMLAVFASFVTVPAQAESKTCELINTTDDCYGPAANLPQVYPPAAYAEAGVCTNFDVEGTISDFGNCAVYRNPAHPLAKGRANHRVPVTESVSSGIVFRLDGRESIDDWPRN